MINKTVNIVLLSLLFVFFSHFLIAQNEDINNKLTDYQIDNWSTEDGLPSNSIIALHQDSRGYLWIGTYSGLIRFDGVRFKNYNRTTTNEITHEGIRDIAETADGSIWASTNGGGLIRVQNEQITVIKKATGLSGNQVYSLKSNNEGQLYIGTEKNIDVLDLKSGEISQLLDAQMQEKVEGPFLSMKLEGKNGTLVGTKTGLFRITNNNEINQLYTETGESAPDVNTISQHHNGQLYISSYSKGIYVLDEKRELLLKPQPVKNLTNINHLLLHENEVTYIASDFGLLKIQEEEISILNEKNGIRDQNITKILIDREKNIWLGSYYGGLFRLKNTVFSKFTEENGLSEKIIHSIYEETGSKIWVCTDKGLNLIENGKVNQLPELNSLLPSGKVRSIVKDPTGYYWIAVYGGLVKYKSPKDFRVFTIDSGLSDNQVRLVKLIGDQLWIGTRVGLNRLNPAEENPEIIRYTKDAGLKNELITSLTAQKDGSLLIGTIEGIHIFEDNRIRQLEIQNQENKNSVFHIENDDENELSWISAVDGLYALKGNEKFKFRDVNNYLNQSIFQSIKDEKGRLWLSIEGGIISVEVKELLASIQLPDTKVNSRLFSKDDGMPTDHSTPLGKGIRLQNNELWFPTLDGIAILHPDRSIRNKFAPQLNIERISLGSDVILRLGEDIKIPGRIQNLEINYTALSFTSPQKVLFKYKLEGLDTGWIAAGNRRTAYYTNILPGTYRFTVIAANSDNVWNEEGASFEFQILPPFWQTPWFYFVAILSIIFILVIVHRLRLQNIKVANKILEQKVNERTLEISSQKEEIEAQRDNIEQKNKELAEAHTLIASQNQSLEMANMGLEEQVEIRTKELKLANEELDEFVYKSSHDIKGPLARILGLCKLAIIEVKDSVALSYFEKLKKETELTDNALKKLIKARNVKTLEINKEIINLKKLIEEIILKIQEQEGLATVNVQLNVNEQTMVSTDSFMLENVLFSLIENAIQYQKTDIPYIEISLQPIVDEYIRILVKNKGFGIVKEAREKIYEMFYKGTNQSKGPGLGLYIAKIAVQRIDGSIRLVSSGMDETEFELSIKMN